MKGTACPKAEVGNPAFEEECTVGGLKGHRAEGLQVRLKVN